MQIQPNEYIRIGKMSKIEKYGWSVNDEPGEMQYVDKNLIFVDLAYQRPELKQRAILRIAASWSWVGCGVIILAKRDGRFYVIDGQQRTAAAMKRSDIKMLPAIVFNSCEQKSEAVGFLKANTERAPVKLIHKLRAMMMAGDKIAERIFEMAEDCGREISDNTGAKVLKCVGKLYEGLKNNREETERVWPVILDICQGRVIHERIVQACIYAEKHGVEKLSDDKWHRRAAKVGYDEILRRCNESAQFYAKGGAHIFAHGLLLAINKGLQHKFELKLNTVA